MSQAKPDAPAAPKKENKHAPSSSLSHVPKRFQKKKGGAAEGNVQVELSEIHSHAKLALEAETNGPSTSPPLSGMSACVGAGLKLLVAVAPINNCTALCHVAYHCGSFPPLRWEVCTSRSAEKPLSLNVVPGEAAPGLALGTWLHHEWLLPSEMLSERRDVGVPLFAKVGAVCIYASEEKDITDETMTDMLPGGGGTAQSMGSLRSSNDGRGRKWKFSGMSYAGCVAACCSLMMPAQFVTSLVVFGTPPTFTVTDGLFPFPHSFVLHSRDLVPNLLDGKQMSRNVARLHGLGFMIPTPPSKKSVDGYTPSCYRYDFEHVVLIHVTAAQLAAANPPPEPAGSPLLSPSSPHRRESELPHDLVSNASSKRFGNASRGTTSDARKKKEFSLHDLPDYTTSLTTKQIALVVPRVEVSVARSVPYDVLQQAATFGARDYFFPLRIVLGKRIIVTPVAAPAAAELLQQYLTDAGEFSDKATALAMCRTTTLKAPAALPPKQAKGQPAAELSKASLSRLEHCLLQFPRLVTERFDAAGRDAALRAGGAMLLDADKVQLDAAPHPPLSTTTLLELAGDTVDSVCAFLKPFEARFLFTAEHAANSLAVWDGGFAIGNATAAAFVRACWLCFLRAAPPKRVPLPRHLQTAGVLEHMAPELRRMLSSPDGCHFSWTVGVASTTHGVGKTTLLKAMLQEVAQTSVFAAGGRSSNEDNPTRRSSVESHNQPQRRGGARGSGDGARALKLKWATPSMSWVERVRRSSVVAPPHGPDHHRSASMPPSVQEQPLDAGHSKPASRAAPASTAGRSTATAAVRDGTAADGTPRTVPLSHIRAVNSASVVPTAVFPQALLLHLPLQEIFWASHSPASAAHVRGCGQVLWVVCDAYSARHLADRFDGILDAAPWVQHVITAVTMRAAGPQPHRNGQPVSGPQDPAGIKDRAEMTAIVVELQQKHRHHDVRYTAVEVAPPVASDRGGRQQQQQQQLALPGVTGVSALAAAAAASQQIIALERLLMQWMVPALPVPVDPRLVPHGVEMGELFLRSSAAVDDYLRGATNYQFEDHPAQMRAADQVRLANYDQRRRPVGAVVGGAAHGAGADHAAGPHDDEVYDDVERGVQAIAVSNVQDPTSPQGDAPKMAF
jgi:hypothetical protein